MNAARPAVDRLSDDIMGATEADSWVGYAFHNPDTGKATRKHAWIVRHGGLYFRSGWYEQA